MTPFNLRSFGGSTIASMPSLSSDTGGESVSGVAARDKAWTKYVDTLKDLLTESKEFLASMTSSQDTLMKETKE